MNTSTVYFSENVRVFAIGVIVVSMLFFDGTPAYAEQTSEHKAVEEANQAFYNALSALDLEKMERVWLHDASVANIGPRSKEPVVGWDAVKAYWPDAFARWQELSASIDVRQIQVTQDAAWIVGVEIVEGKLKEGKELSTTVLGTNIFKKVDGEWRMVHHHASRLPK